MKLIVCDTSPSFPVQCHTINAVPRFVSPFTQATAIFRRAFKQQHGWVVVKNFRPLAEALGHEIRPFIRLILKAGGVWITDTRSTDSPWILPSRARVIKVIDTVLHLQESQFPGAANFVNFVGHAGYAQTLFVGEQINPVYRHFGHWPWHANVGCAVYLHQCLDQIGFDETNAVWTNIIHEEDHIKNLLAFNPNLRVVALGKKAEQGLLQRGVAPVAVLPHPQYARRFLRHTFDYKAALANALTFVLRGSESLHVRDAI